MMTPTLAMERPSMRRVSSLPFQKLNDEVLVVDPRTREVHLLNMTAARVWELLEQPQTEDDLLRILTDEFDAPRETLQADLAGVLGELQAKGLVGPDARLEERAEADTQTSTKGPRP